MSTRSSGHKCVQHWREPSTASSDAGTGADQLQVCQALRVGRVATPLVDSSDQSIREPCEPAPYFDNEPIELMSIVSETKERVQNYLSEYGTLEIDKDGDVSFHHEGLRVFVRVESFGVDHSVVRVFCHPLSGLRLTPDLFEFVARENSFRFGKMWIAAQSDGEGGALFFEHTLLGTYIDPEELLVTTQMIAETSADLRSLESRFSSLRRPK